MFLDINVTIKLTSFNDSRQGLSLLVYTFLKTLLVAPNDDVHFWKTVLIPPATCSIGIVTGRPADKQDLSSLDGLDNDVRDVISS